MICVIEVVGGPAKGKRVWIRDTEQLEVGRHSSVSLSIPSDPHLSRRHLLIEGVDGKFRARDLGSANGTLLNRAAIQAVELFDGDLLQVGNTLLSLSFQQDGANPHAKDGIQFGSKTNLQPDRIDSESALTRRFDVSGSIANPPSKDLPKVANVAAIVSVPIRTNEGNVDAEKD